MLLFLMGSSTLSFMAVWQSRAQAAPVAPVPLITGKWTPLYEDVFNKKLFTYNSSKDGWGIINYVAFREGSEGVLVGDDNWLFTKEEFDYQPGQKEKIHKNLDFIHAVHDYLKRRDIELVVVPVPSKARVYRDRLGRYKFPGYKENIYSTLISDLRAHNIRAVNLLPVMEKGKKTRDVFLKTDTHWTPDGAQLAARAIAGYLARDLDYAAGESEYRTILNERETYKGDLLRYIPVGDFSSPLGLPEDVLPVFQTVETGIAPAAGDTAEMLFSKTAPQITLVGTSYSANPKWNFEGFLKENLHTDILNAAEEGKGPFEIMDKYLKNKAFLETPPRLVLWEIPERYISFNYDLETDFHSDGI